MNQVEKMNHMRLFVEKLNQQKYYCDSMKIFQSSYSEKLPSERYNGMMNLFYILFNLNATTEEIESALVIMICAEFRDGFNEI